MPKWLSCRLSPITTFDAPSLWVSDTGTKWASAIVQHGYGNCHTSLFISPVRGMFRLLIVWKGIRHAWYGSALTLPNPSIHIDHRHGNPCRFLSAPYSTTHQEFWANAPGSYNPVSKRQFFPRASWYPPLQPFHFPRESDFGHSQRESFVRHMIHESNRVSTKLARGLDWSWPTWDQLTTVETNSSRPVWSL